jgi:hypothetical protein
MCFCFFSLKVQESGRKWHHKQVSEIELAFRAEKVFKIQSENHTIHWTCFSGYYLDRVHLEYFQNDGILKVSHARKKPTYSLETNCDLLFFSC